jgi:tetratricopeptide (TPR) repeat protein
LIGALQTPPDQTSEDRILLDAILESVYDGPTLVEPKVIVKICSDYLKSSGKKDPSKSARALMARCNAFCRLNLFDEMKKDADELCLLTPTDARAFQQQACALGLLKRLPEALESAKKAMQLDPRSGYSPALVGLFLHLQGDSERGLTWANKGVDLDSKDARALEIRAKIRFVTCRYQECLDDLDLCLRLTPLSGYQPEAQYLLRGLALGSLDRLEEAIPWYTIARRLNPDSAGAVAMQMQAYLVSEKWNLQLLSAREWARLDPKNPLPEAYCALGFARTGNAEEATRIAKSVLATDGAKNVGVVTMIGQVYEALGQFEASLASYNKALELDARTGKAIDVLVAKARLLSCCPEAKFRDGREALRIAMQLELLNMDGSGPHARLILKAQAQAECGEFNQAVASAQRAIELTRPGSCFRTKYEDMLRLFQSKQPYRLSVGK